MFLNLLPLEDNSELLLASRFCSTEKSESTVSYLLLKSQAAVKPSLYNCITLKHHESLLLWLSSELKMNFDDQNFLPHI